jgi:hypothetical protein
MQTIQTEKQAKLVNALKNLPKQHEVKVPEHLQSLVIILNDFRFELEWNINCNNNYAFSLEYVKKLLEEFTMLYMISDGTMDILLFPEIITSCESIKMNKIKTVLESHKFIYHRTIFMLRNRESMVLTKIQFRIPILDKDEVTESKYLIREKMIMCLIEIGYSLYYIELFVLRNGEEMQLYQFLKDFGLFAGVEIQNIKQRIKELKNKPNRHKVLDRMIKVLENM